MEASMEGWNKLLAGELLKGTTEKDTIAILSAPCVLVALKNLMSETRGTAGAMTTRWMANSSGSTDAKVINLNNEFWSYANFTCEHWNWRD
ncbi:hypothetical protein SODALDRAFT_360196 [Sodiomyces alkalinus F11]|uniref:Uncharacterized protein n=1 Tax=Sodiomyces alkalinus (strain CBS 110278 / VKM F-3762 / F11) TaxID=1314773 RepID=A0A3N2PTS0_SODAK|nr:hypothetical protein SODALDRAFT_360196 [Sodiomyces alkalinus F11]ROT37902.1 hypothetical protein SODALDRAFT_360196 [Sodiomyces alkalinus F11]